MCLPHAHERVEDTQKIPHGSSTYRVPDSSRVDTVINVKGLEATQQRSSGHLWEGERRIIVRLMFPHPIHDM